MQEEAAEAFPPRSLQRTAQTGRSPLRAMAPPYTGAACKGALLQMCYSLISSPLSPPSARSDSRSGPGCLTRTRRGQCQTDQLQRQGRKRPAQFLHYMGAFGKTFSANDWGNTQKTIWKLEEQAFEGRHLEVYWTASRRTHSPTPAPT